MKDLVEALCSSTRFRQAAVLVAGREKSACHRDALPRELQMLAQMLEQESA